VEISKEESKEKRISGEAYDINTQIIYIALKSKIESRAHYAPAPAWGSASTHRVAKKVAQSSNHQSDATVQDKTRGKVLS